MSQPLVSIVIPVFNGLRFLPQAIESVLNQTYPSIELVLADGGSTDGSSEWIADSGYRHELLSRGTPAWETWTSVTKLARGDFITLLCQDDILYPDAIESQIQTIKANPGVSASIAQRDIINADGEVILRRRGLAGLSNGTHQGMEVLKACYRQGANVIGEPHTLLVARDSLLQAMPWKGERPYLLDLDTYTTLFMQPGITAAVQRRSIGAFRVSSNSWSTRLVEQQVHQFDYWRKEFASRARHSRTDSLLGWLGVRLHGIARAAAYRWLHLIGKM